MSIMYYISNNILIHSDGFLVVILISFLYPQTVPAIFAVPMDCVCRTQAYAMEQMTVEMEVMRKAVVILEWENFSFHFYEISGRIGWFSFYEFILY